MNARTIILSLVMLLVIPVVVAAAEPAELTPHWSVEVKGGYFYPDIENWKTFYGDDKTWHYAGSIAYKLFRQLEIGVEAGLIKDNGRAYAPLNAVIVGNVVYEVAPVNVFVLVRGVFSENQWLVPYAGGGWTRIYYREEIEGQATVRGSVNGYHGRAGLQLLLDGMDSRAANNMLMDYGVHHTYFFGEVQITHATVGTPEVNLGGTSYLMGFLFEF
jgi:hypothetical protein